MTISFHSLQIRFVGIDAVNLFHGEMINHPNVLVEVHNYQKTNSAAFLVILTALEMEM